MLNASLEIPVLDFHPLNFNIAHNCKDLEALVKKENLWELVLDPSSFLFSSEFLDRLLSPARPVLPQFLEVVLRRHSDRVGVCPHFFDLILSLAVRGSWPERKETLSTLSTFHSFSEQFSTSMLQAFDRHLSQVLTLFLPSFPSRPLLPNFCCLVTYSIKSYRAIHLRLSLVRNYHP